MCRSILVPSVTKEGKYTFGIPQFVVPILMILLFTSHLQFVTKQTGVLRMNPGLRRPVRRNREFLYSLEIKL